MTKEKSADSIVSGLIESIEALGQATKADGLSGPGRKKLNVQIKELVVELESIVKDIDLRNNPSHVFDPTNPAVVGRFIALALVAQERYPIKDLEDFYGAGVYALYYTGPFEPYAPISSKEVPLYVGKAEPKDSNARTPFEQKDKLFGRLNEHRKSIAKAHTTLNIADFECRYLVVQSGWELAAETYLINFFRPVWNKQTNICYGIGKHGDSYETRSNKRSPWDTLHLGRSWANAPVANDAMSEEKIRERLASHFARLKEEQAIYDDVQAVLKAFLDGLRV
jgi:hypothetical protein